MYKKRRKNIIMIIVIIIIGIIFLFLGLFLSKKEENSILENLLKDASLFINNFLIMPFNDNLNNTCDDNINKELQYQIDILKETLELNNTLNESDKSNAIIINRNLEYWYDNITLNKGANHGVEVGDAVVVNSGLVARIVSVSKYNSVGRLLTSEASNKISVKVETNDGYAYGLITDYDDEQNIYNLEGISETVEIKVDSIVTTTGIGDNFPSGIVIGKVKNITTDNYDLAKLIEVTPSVDFNSLSIVTILKRNVK